MLAYKAVMSQPQNLHIRIPQDFWGKRSTANRVFLSATPFHHTRLCHVLPQLCMLEFSIGKGRQVCKPQVMDANPALAIV